MTTEILYRVLQYIGTKLVGVLNNLTEEEARRVTTIWPDSEFETSCKCDPPLPKEPAIGEEWQEITTLPTSLFMVTYETEVGEINIVTNDDVVADVYVGELLTALGLIGSDATTLNRVVDSVGVHVVIMNSRIVYNDLDPKEILEFMQRAKLDSTKQ